MEQFNSLPLMKNGKKAMSSQAVAWALFLVFAFLLAALIVFSSMFYFFSKIFVGGYADLKGQFIGVSFDYRPEWNLYSHEYDEYHIVEFSDGYFDNSHISISYYPAEEIDGGADARRVAHTLASDRLYDYEIHEMTTDDFLGRTAYTFSISCESISRDSREAELKMFEYGAGTMIIEYYAPDIPASYEVQYEQFLSSIKIDGEYEAKLT